MMVAAGFQNAVSIVSVAGLIAIQAGRYLIQVCDAQPYPRDQSSAEENNAKTFRQTANPVGRIRLELPHPAEHE